MGLWWFAGLWVAPWVGCWLGLFDGNCHGRVVVRGWVRVCLVDLGGWCGLLERVGLVLRLVWGLGLVWGWDPRVGLHPLGFGVCGLVAEGFVVFCGVWVCGWLLGLGVSWAFWMAVVVVWLL